MMHFKPVDKRPNVKTMAFLEEVVECLDAYTLSPLPEHADDRRYFRLEKPGVSYVVMESWQAVTTVKKFLTTSKAHQQLGLPVPDLHHATVDKTGSCCLMSDFGQTTLLDAINHHSWKSNNPDKMAVFFSGIDLIHQYQQSDFHQVLQLHSASAQQAVAQANEGLGMFAEVMLGQVKTTEILSQSVMQSLHRLWSQMPSVNTHKDFHSANIMLLPLTLGGGLGMLDYQDVCKAPYVYDYVSLIDDHYCLHSPEERHRWNDYAYQLLAGPLGISHAQFCEDCCLVSVQRHLKNLGVFTRMLVKGKRQYRLPLMHVTQRLYERCSELPLFSSLKHWVATMVMDSLNHQPLMHRED
jgi:aminoglycoside/choline kinase family phosphotransferase